MAREIGRQEIKEVDESKIISRETFDSSLLLLVANIQDVSQTDNSFLRNSTIIDRRYR